MNLTKQDLASVRERVRPEFAGVPELENGRIANPAESRGTRNFWLCNPSSDCQRLLFCNDNDTVAKNVDNLLYAEHFNGSTRYVDQVPFESSIGERYLHLKAAKNDIAELYDGAVCLQLSYVQQHMRESQLTFVTIVVLKNDLGRESLIRAWQIAKRHCFLVFLVINWPDSCEIADKNDALSIMLAYSIAINALALRIEGLDPFRDALLAASPNSSAVTELCGRTAPAVGLAGCVRKTADQTLPDAIYLAA